MSRTHRPLRITVVLLFVMSIGGIGLLRADTLSSAASPIVQTHDVPVIDTTSSGATSRRRVRAHRRVTSRIRDRHR